MALKIGVIGPTNVQKLTRLTRKPANFFLKRARQIGRILADIGAELWVNSDQGMLVGVIRGYREARGKKIVILWPRKSEPWPRDHAKHYVKYADFVRKEPNWFWTNYNVVALPDICVCVGLSAGTLSELAYIKWNYKLKRGRLKRLVVIKELLRDGKFPPEIEFDIKQILTYIGKTKDLAKALKRFSI